MPTSYKDTLPLLLQPHYAYVPPVGHIVWCLPEDVLAHENLTREQLKARRLPVPVEYVIKKGYRLHEGLITVDTACRQETGLATDEVFSRPKKINVGQRLEAFAGRGQLQSLSVTATGLLLVLTKPQPSDATIHQYKTGQPALLRLCQKSGFLSLVAKFGEEDWTAAPYHPALAKNHPSPLPKEATGQLTLLLVCSVTGTVLHLRRIQLAPHFSLALATILATLAEDRSPAHLLREKIQSLYASTTPCSLAKLSLVKMNL